MSPTSTGVIAAAQTAAALLSERVPLAIALALAAFLVLFTALEGCARRGLMSPEATRKLLHTGSGLLTLSFPFVFHDFWPVLLLTSASAGLLAIVRFVPLFRGRLAGVTTRVGRVSLGELYFPLSVALLRGRRELPDRPPAGKRPRELQRGVHRRRRGGKPHVLRPGSGRSPDRECGAGRPDRVMVHEPGGQRLGIEVKWRRR